MAYYDPLQVESIFQETLRLLMASPSERIQINLIDRFLDFISGNEKKFESYLIQIVQQLPVLNNPLIYAGIDPEIFNNFIGKLEHSFSVISDDSSADQLRKHIEKYQAVLFQIYGWVGVDDGVHEHENQLVIPQKVIKEENGDVIIPVVEEFDGVYSGRLRKLHIEVISKSKNGFELKPAFGVIGADAGSFIKPVESAVERLATQSGHKITPWKASVFFETPHSWHAGKSANLAISGTFYCELLKAEDLQEQFWINPAACITGEIDDFGNVLPVAYNTLKLKVEAAFFSWVQVLVVPLAQLDEAQSHIQDLKKDYPNRDLPVIAVSHLKELFFDRRVSLYHKTDALNHNLKKVWRRRNSTAITIILITLLVIIGKLVYGPLDKNPVVADFAGNSMILKNSSGAILKEIQVGTDFVNRENEKSLHKYYLLVDIDEDGFNDVVYFKYVRNNENYRDSLYSFSVIKNDFIWKQPVSMDLDFSHRPDIEDDTWTIRQLLNVNFGNEKIFLSSYQSRLYFPGTINKHDLKTGQIIDSYVHPGRIMYMITEDINEDGSDEIIFLANNNDYWGAVLGILDIDKMNGTGPSTDLYKPKNLTSAKENGYVRFPRTVIAKTGGNQKGTTPRHVYYKSEKKIITVIIIDYLFKNIIDSEDNPQMVYRFDKELNLLSVGSSNSWDVLAREFYQEGKLSFEPGLEYLEAFKDSLEWWDGEKFVNYPTLANPHPID